MRFAILLRCLLVLLLLQRAATAATVIYVSHTGNDAYPGTAAQPVATPQGAQTCVRSLIAAGLTDSVEVRFAAGTYRISAPLELGPQDSGTAAYPITWKAAAGATVIHFATMNTINAPNFILNNWVYDIWGYEQKSTGVPVCRLPNGISLDWNTSNTTVRNNWTYNSPVAAAVKTLFVDNQNLVISDNPYSNSPITPPFGAECGPAGTATNGIDLANNRFPAPSPTQVATNGVIEAIALPFPAQIPTANVPKTPQFFRVSVRLLP